MKLGNHFQQQVMMQMNTITNAGKVRMIISCTFTSCETHQKKRI